MSPFISILQTGTFSVDATRSGHKGAPGMMAATYSPSEKTVSIQVISELGKKPNVGVACDLAGAECLVAELQKAINKAKEHLAEIAKTPAKPQAPAQAAKAALPKAA